MIRCVIQDGTVRYFPFNVVSQIAPHPEGGMVVIFTRPDGEVARSRISEFMIVKTGVRVTT